MESHKGVKCVCIYRLLASDQKQTELGVCVVALRAHSPQA
eukprot:SAG11_NODE_28122_length_325_cov_0.858407_1_plen_39_part_10